MSRNIKKVQPTKPVKKHVSKNVKWTRIIAGAIAGILALLMIFSMGFDMIMSISAAPVTQKEIDSLRAQQKQMAANKKKLEGEISAIKNDKKEISAQITKIDQQISMTEDEIELHENLIKQYAEFIAVKQLELEASIVKQDEQYKKMHDRVRFMYENGNMSYLEILLSAENFSEFLSRYEIISQISTYEKKLFEELKAAKEQVELQKLELEQSKADEEGAKVELEAKKKQLDADMKARAAKMDSLSGQEGDARASYAQIDEEEERVNKEILKKVAALAAQGAYVGGTFAWPLPAANNVVTCKFGMRTHPITGVYKLHTGVDLRGSSGTKIFAANSGEIITSTYSSAYGNYVVINHGGGVSTLYAHMRKAGLPKGTKVSRGQVIGYVGSTGYSTGPHLHFEIIKNGKFIDPMSQYKKS